MLLGIYIPNTETIRFLNRDFPDETLTGPIASSQRSERSLKHFSLSKTSIKFWESKYCEIQEIFRGEDQPRRSSRLHRSPGSGLSGRTITVPLAGAPSVHAWLDAEPVIGTVHSLPIRSRIAAKKVRSTARSAIWNVTAFTWVTTLVSILISFSHNVVKLQCPTDKETTGITDDHSAGTPEATASSAPGRERMVNGGAAASG